MYALDALRNGNWIVQTDPSGDPASKPPVYTWLVAACAAALGRVDEASLYVPTAFAMLGVALLAFRSAGARFGEAAGLAAGAAFLLSPYGVKHLALARTDAVFGFAVAAAALAGYRAWASPARGRWLLFWMLCAVATLTKGPLGVLIAGSGLLAAAWEGRSASSWDSRRGASVEHAAGVALYLVVCGGWLLAAYLELGRPVIDKLIGRELLGHAAAGDTGSMPLVAFYKPIFYFITRFAPWSIPALVGVWRVFAQSSASGEERRFERFLACWFCVGLVVFSIAPHQRPDLLLPLVPAGAMLAGREMARWLRRRPGLRIEAAVIAAAAVAAGVVVVDRHIVKRRDPVVVRTAEWRDLARRLDSIAGGRPGLVDVDAPMALQMFLQIHQRRVPRHQAADALAGDAAVLVAARKRPWDDGFASGHLLASLDDAGGAVEIMTNDPAVVLPR